MFESALLVIDKLIALVRIRNENNRYIFTQIVEPLFQEAQKAHEDYRLFVREVKALAEQPTNHTTAQMNHILQRREECRALRTKIRTLASVYMSARHFDSAIRDFMLQVEWLFVGPRDHMVPLEPPPPAELDSTVPPDESTNCVHPTAATSNSPAKICLVGPTHAGKTYLFQSLVYRLKEKHRASVFSPESSDNLEDQYRADLLASIGSNSTFSEDQWEAVCRSYATLKVTCLKPM